MSIPISHDGQVVAITGGARGAGVGIVDAFLRAGSVVETCGRSPKEDSPVPPGVNYSQVDLRDADACAAWFSEIGNRHGRLDTLINNVGGSPAGAFTDGSANFHRKVLELNLTTAINSSLSAYPFLAETAGSVVNITSISARRPSPGTAIYGAAKAGLESLTRSLAVEWARTVRVNSVSCGLIEVPNADGHYGSEEQRSRIADTIPNGRFASPVDVGMACVFLASALSAHTTGATLNVDGGGEWPAFLAHAPYPNQPR